MSGVLQKLPQNKREIIQEFETEGTEEEFS
jgi:hypothetical protein